MRVLYDKAAVPLADPQVAGDFSRSWRLMSIGRFCLEVADSDANVERLGRPASARGVGRGVAFPQVRWWDWPMWIAREHRRRGRRLPRRSEQSAGGVGVRSLLPDLLLLAVRGFFGYTLWDKLAATGRPAVARSSPTRCCLSKSGPATALSVLASIRGPRPGAPADCIDVQVVKYTRAPGDTDADERTYRLMAIIADPDAASAAEHAQLHTQPWEIETAFAELKTHQRGPGMVLRSKMPDGVLRIYGYLRVHYAIRWLMHSAAHRNYGLDPDRPSVTRSLRRLRVRGLITRIPHTHRYRLTEHGLHTAMFISAVHDRFLPTGLAQLADELTSPPLRAASRTYRNALDNLAGTTGLAA